MDLHLSASSLPRAERCPASASLPRNGHHRESAERGKLLHAQMEAEQPDGAEVAYALNVLTGEARRLGQSLGRDYGSLAVGEIAGTTDREVIEPARVVIRDYKSGFGFGVAPPAENLQLAFYAVAAARVHSKGAARVELEYMDRGQVESADLDALDLAAAFARIRAVYDAAARPEPAIVTGDHCAMCPCFSRCPAQLGVALTVATGKLPAELPVLELTRDAVARGWPILMAYRKLLGEVERAYRAYAAGEPVPLGEGRWLGPVTKRTEELDGTTAANVLRELHGPEVAAVACEISTSKAAIERALATIAKRGEKAGMMRRVLDRVAAAGGVRQKFKNGVEEYDEHEEAGT